MLEISTLIVLIVTISGIYIPLLVNLYKEIRDIKSNGTLPFQDAVKIIDRKKILVILTIFTILSILLIIVLFILPPKFFNNIKSLTSSDLIPFKKGFFENKNFAFSYITEFILSLITLALVILICIKQFIKKLDRVILTIPDKNRIKLIVFAFIILFIYITIWTNNFFSQFLIDSIILHFLLLSIIFNIALYFLVGYVSYLLLFSFINLDRYLRYGSVK